MIHVGGISESYLRQNMVVHYGEMPPTGQTYNIHNPVPMKCQKVGQSRWELGPYLERQKALFQVYHYTGTLEQRDFRADPRGGFGNRTAAGTPPPDKCLKVPAEDLRPWLRGFITLVGKDEAKRLLDGVGRVHSWPPYVNDKPIINDDDYLATTMSGQPGPRPQKIWSTGNALRTRVELKPHGQRQQLPPEAREQSPWEYLRSFRSVGSRRPLVFLHVPKTGGTSIEAVAASRGVAWGMSAFPLKSNNSSTVSPYQGSWPHSDWWHIPRQYFPLLRVDPYSDAEVFAGVRDVYRYAMR